MFWVHTLSNYCAKNLIRYPTPIQIASPFPCVLKDDWSHSSAYSEAPEKSSSRVFWSSCRSIIFGYNNPWCLVCVRVRGCWFAWDIKSKGRGRIAVNKRNESPNMGRSDHKSEGWPVERHGREDQRSDGRTIRTRIGTTKNRVMYKCSLSSIETLGFSISSRFHH